MTLPTQVLLGALMADPAKEFYGLELVQLAGLASGTVHPILARLESYGWLESRWEDEDPRRAGRPRRRYYRLTPDGVVHATRALERARTPVSLLARLAPGQALGGSP
jgi:DNA-binding PadR family transcriptional regulator